MSKSKRAPFRPKISIHSSGFASGHGHINGFSGTIGTASAGLGCVRCTSLGEAMQKYWQWIERLNYPVLDKAGQRYLPSEVQR